MKSKKFTIIMGLILLGSIVASNAKADATLIPASICKPAFSWHYDENIHYVLNGVVNLSQQSILFSCPLIRDSVKEDLNRIRVYGRGDAEIKIIAKHRSPLSRPDKEFIITRPVVTSNDWTETFVDSELLDTDFYTYGAYITLEPGSHIFSFLYEEDNE